MSTSRDDFVIAIRSAFLKKSTKQRFSLISLILFSLLLIFFSKINFTPINYVKISINEILYRLSFVTSLPEKQLRKSVVIINEHLNLYEEYKINKNKLNELESRSINSNYILEENERLRKLIDEYIVQTNEIVGKVLLDKDSPFLKSIIVNKGSKDEIQLGMAVLDEGYLVGKVVEVNFSTSRILLISDLNSKIPVALEPGNLQSIITGTGKKNGTIQYFEEDAEIEEQSIAYTSGSGGIFKPGIPIGIVKIVDEENKKYEVDFFSKLSQLTFVKLVSYEKEQ